MVEEEEEPLVEEHPEEEEEVGCRACEITEQHVNCYKHILDFIISLIMKLIK